MNNEQLSALMDDELTADVSRETVGQLLADAESRATWGRYHLIGAAVRGAPAALVSPPANVVTFPNTTPRPVSRFAVGLAAAAALAAVALVLSPKALRDSPPFEMTAAQILPVNNDKPLADVDGAATDLSKSVTTAVNQTFIVRGDETQQRMNSYVTDFNEQRARQPTPGVHRYVHIVGFDTH